MVATTLHSPPASTHSPSRVATRLGRLAFIVGALCALAALVAGPLYRIGLLPLGPAIQTMRWAATIAIGGAVVALAALLWQAARQARPQALGVAALALLLNLMVAGPPLVLYFKLQQLPKIHDITTDTANPPAFDAVVPLREGARNSIDYAPAVAAEQHKGYPDIAPLSLPLAPPAAFDRAVQTARMMGWEIVAVVPDKLRLEATDTTLLFGFKDDVVVRVTPQGNGSVVDVRSLSRVGGSDFGTNAKRVRAYLKLLADNVNGTS